MQETMERMASYINVFCAPADDEEGLFGKRSFDNTREFLEHECSQLQKQAIFRHIARRTNDNRHAFLTTELEARS